MANPVKSFFLFCSGATGTILKGCNVEHSKYVGIGATIFFTAVLAALSGGYAMFRVFDDATLASSFGLLWGLIIFNLDRFIVSSMRKRKAGANLTLAGRFALKGGELLKALPRLILAVFISIVITRPLELKLFQTEIQGQLTSDLTAERVKAEDDLKNEYAGRGLDKLEADTEKLKNRLTDLQNVVNERVQAARGELQGWDGTMRNGAGPMYLKRQAEAEKAQADLDSFKKQNEETIKSNEERITALKKEKEDKLTAINKKIDNQSGGLLKQLDALSRMTSGDSSVFLASLFIMLLFISLETAPILVKLFSSRGPYDDHLDAIEHGIRARQLKDTSDLNDDINRSVATSKQVNAIRQQEEVLLYKNTWASLRTELQDAYAEIGRQNIARWKASQLNQPNGTPTSNPAQPPTLINQNGPTGPPAPPPNVPQGPVPAGAAVPAPPLAIPVNLPSLNGGRGQAAAAAPAQAAVQQPAQQIVVPSAPTAGAQPTAPAATGQAAPSTAQQTPAATGPQNGLGTVPAPQNPGSSTPNP